MFLAGALFFTNAVYLYEALVNTIHASLETPSPHLLQILDIYNAASHSAKFRPFVTHMTYEFTKSVAQTTTTTRSPTTVQHDPATVQHDQIERFIVTYMYTIV